MATGVTIVGVGTASGGTGAVTPGLPSGWAAGDIHYLFHNSKRLESVATPSGWTILATATPASDNKLIIYERVAQSGDTAPTVADSGDHGYAIILGLRGASLTEVTPVTATAAANTAASWPSINVGGANRLVILAAADGLDATGNRFSGMANANLANIVEQWDNGISSNDGGGLVIYTADASVTGAIGASTGTYSSAVSQALITFAVYSAGGAAYTLPADAGAYVVAGTDAVLRVGRKLAAAAGAFVVTGTAALFRRDRRIVANPGAFVVTGTDATFTFGQKNHYLLDAESGAFVISGTDVRFRYKVTPPVDRSVSVLAEDRSAVVLYEDRSVAVDADPSRRVSVDPETRLVAAEPEESDYA